MSRTPSLVTRLLTLAAARPALYATLARLVADEDGATLGRLLARLGICVTPQQVEDLLDQPGPFRPAVTGWT